MCQASLHQVTAQGALKPYWGRGEGGVGGATREGGREGRALWRRARESGEDPWVEKGKGEKGHAPRTLPLPHH